MQLVFIILSILGVIYIFIKKRQFDFFSISFLSAVVYFVPGFVGKVMNPYAYTKLDTPISDKTILVFIMVEITIFIGMILYDFSEKSYKKFDIKKPLLFTHTSFLISLIAFIIMYLKFGNIIFSFGTYNKKEVLELMAGDRWSLLWIYSASFCLLSAWHDKSKIFITLSILMFCIHLLIGHRSNAAFIFITATTIFLSDMTNNKTLVQLLKKHALKFILFLVAITFFFFIKLILPLIKVLNFDLISKNADNSDYWMLAFTKSEPFLIQANLNKVLTDNITTDGYHIFDIISVLIPFSPEIGFDVSGNTFGKYLSQEMIFPGLNYGIANNIWASIWAGYGWIGLFIFIILFVIIIAWASNLLRTTTGFLRGFIALFFTQFFFYIHRNDIFTQIGLQKRSLILFISCFIFSLITTRILKLLLK